MKKFSSIFSEVSVSDYEIRRPSSVSNIAEIIHRLLTIAKEKQDQVYRLPSGFAVLTIRGPKKGNPLIKREKTQL